MTASLAAQFADLVEGVWREHTLTLDARELRLVFSAHLCILDNYFLRVRNHVHEHLEVIQYFGRKLELFHLDPSNILTLLIKHLWLHR